MSRILFKYSENMTKVKRITKNLILSVIIFITALNSFKSYSDGAEADSSVIRVGLEGIYYNKDSMSIRNSKLVMGYTVNNVFESEMTISDSGLTFVPYKNSFSISGTYSDYDTALKAAKSEKGNAIPVVTYNKSWAVATLGAGKTDKYAVRVSGNNIDMLYTIDDRGQYPQFASLNEVYVDLGERQYRGRIEIGTYGDSKLKTVSIVELEEYLYSVVACEMTASWHIEALKAQAVCARSYAVCSTGYGGSTNVEKPYTINDTTASQVYRGYSGEHERSIEAVKATKGQCVYYKGEPVRAFYSSTSGGSTENVEDVWGSPKGYLRQVSDIYELDPELEPWIKEFSADKIEELLYENNIDIGNVTDIRPNVYTASGRVYSMEVIGDEGRYTISAERIRMYFSLYSTKYKVIKYGDNPDYVSMVSATSVSANDISSSYIMSGNGESKPASENLEQYIVLSADNLYNYPRVTPKDKNTYYIAGMGYGHGVGMSQSGAKGMAENGFEYIEILEHYYTDIVIK